MFHMKHSREFFAKIGVSRETLGANIELMRGFLIFCPKLLLSYAVLQKSMSFFMK